MSGVHPAHRLIQQIQAAVRITAVSMDALSPSLTGPVLLLGVLPCAICQDNLSPWALLQPPKPDSKSESANVTKHVACSAHLVRSHGGTGSGSRQVPVVMLVALLQRAL
jgi:hypothetical protein